MKIRHYALIVAILAAFVLSGAVKTPAFAGRAHSQQVFSPEKGVVVIGNENKLATVYGIDVNQKKKIWEVRQPQSRDVSITIDGDKVFLVGSQDIVSFDSIIRAHELTGNKTLWSKDIKGFKRTTPVYMDEGNLYFGADVDTGEKNMAVLYALDKNTGKSKWEFSSGRGNLKSLYQLADGNFVLLIEEKKKITNTNSESKFKLVKIDKNTGAKMWETPLNGLPPYEVKEIDGTLCFVLREKSEDDPLKKIESFNIINLQDGKIASKYTFDEENTLYGEPLYVQDKVIFATNSAKLICLSVKSPSMSEGPKWKVEIGESFAFAPIITGDKVISITNKSDKEFSISVFSVETGEKLWAYAAEGTPSAPVFTENGVILLSSDNSSVGKFSVTAVDMKDGRKVWSIEQNGSIEQPLFIAGKFACLATTVKGENRSLLAINLSNGAIEWTYGINDAISSSPVLAGENLVFSTKDGNVVSITLSNGKENFKKFIGNENELDTNVVESGNLIGFATVEGQYYIMGTAGEDEKKLSLKPLFAYNKMPVLIGALVLGFAMSWYIYHAKKGKDMFIRRIAGLNAIDEAVGRSTEMGKPVLYITGLADVDDIQTLASLSVMGHIAQKTAEYDTPLVVPCCRSVVMSTAQEVVKESYLKAGRPDTYRRENIHYLTDDQFGYVAGVDGIMLREKPAANFYMGKFYAESLILAETGHSTGAIQIAGTAEASQLPFFVAACDYTLIGEELFAASAYLSKDPMQIGSLKGQDIAKAIIMIAILSGSILLSFGFEWVKILFTTQ